MVAPFPVAKLGIVFAKQLSKPIANFCKESAKSSPVFRKYVCIPPAQFYNWCEVKLKMWILNLGKPVNIPVLNEAMAIDLGANLLGETILFIIAGALVIAEYNRSARKEEKKEKQILEEKAKLGNTINDLYFENQKQSTEIRELRRMIYDLESYVLKQHPKASREPIIIKPKDDDTPPPPPSNSLVKDNHSISPSHEEQEEFKNKSIILNALANIEEQLWKRQTEERQVGIITLAVNHVCQDVYRLPLRL